MVEITKVYDQDMGSVRFIGKKYTNADRVDGLFSHLWTQWFDNDWFQVIDDVSVDEDFNFEDELGQIGMIRGEGENFEYWIGLFTPPNTVIPEGYESIDFASGKIGVCWVYGDPEDVYMMEGKCAEKLIEAGYDLAPICFERYTCPRFTEPDEDNRVILDVGFFLAS